ncbi:response regulator [Derxia gummosa]|uniref:Response regulator n=1 Tax=Derxia gummosa DSM 723 TaxID=1121388 RepID=A0A8B6X259_9BURK|nr:response regulator [Derxia gummosa]
MRLLIVEDDTQIGDSLCSALGRAGHAVDVARNGLEAEHALAGAEFDLVLLDLGLPGKSGTEVLRALRARGSKTPVIVITARDGLGERVDTLDLGADDYLVKPFELAELQARIRAVLRRAVANTAGPVQVGRLRLMSERKTIECDGAPLELSPREYGLLEVLMMRAGTVVSKAQIEEHLCNWDDALAESAIELYVHRVRRKLDRAGAEIRTARGFGYMLVAIEDKTPA